MTDLADFLLARIGETEEAARRLPLDERWYACDDGCIATPIDTGPDGEDNLPNHHNSWAVVLDPAHVLAECEAKRAIVELVGDEIPHYAPLGREWEWCPKVRTADYCEGTDLAYGPDAPCECGADEQNAHGGSRIVRLLALPYAGHPDYEERWRP